MRKKTDKVRFNFVDVVIIGLVLVLLAAGAYKLFIVNRNLGRQNGLIEYKVLVENIRMPTVDSIIEGQEVKDVQTNIAMGTIVNKEISSYKQAVPTLDGRVVQAEVPEKYNAVITIRSPAIVTENNITIGNKEIKTGGPISIKSNIFSVTGIFYGVTVK
ncbi:MAG: hypothetical protein A4E55_02096 [Pelotomaculum sp. PtaU1.Bin035]|nr:MAG: hypothetical protein A4E55_02096 [Pelotomaculum sp. PtaU1.Bin035]